MMSGGESNGKRALVTGGTKGIGDAIVRRLAAGCARVATAARETPSSDQQAEMFIQADITRSPYQLRLRTR
jgi:NAD(P)-dependent dehydrogenase (short-subunit alcohol dehydrogenase family)